MPERLQPGDAPRGGRATGRRPAEGAGRAAPGPTGLVDPTPPAGAGRVFLISPADCGGERARLILSARAGFPLAVRLRDGGAPLGEIMSFMSALYFRGKYAYARAFARPPAGVPGALVITPTAGLVPADSVVTREDLRRFARGDVHPDRPGYRRPLAAAAATLAAALAGADDVVLLGSVATTKYASVLAPILGPRLSFPRAFAGLGDMSRGALLLRAVRAGVELEYAPLTGIVRRDPRPTRPSLESMDTPGGGARGRSTAPPRPDWRRR